MKIGVSACLLGYNVRYNGSNKRNSKIIELLNGHEIISVCPEVFAGLPIPHAPIELRNNEVIDYYGKNYTTEIQIGIQKAFDLSKDCDLFILKSKSPTCGVSKIYDGSFTDTLIDGDGLFAKLCKNNGKLVFSENDIDKLKELLKK